MWITLGRNVPRMGGVLRNLHLDLSRISSQPAHDPFMRLLVVEDEPRLAEQLSRGLRADGYAVDVARTAEDALWLATESPYDGVILDIGLPDGDGFSLCADLRRAGRWSPVLMLTARAAVADRVRGLDVGADDYMLKPFSFTELLARVRALVRRAAPERPVVLRLGGLELDRPRRTVHLDGRRLDLSIREFALLELFLRRRDEVLTRAEILEHVWDWAYDGSPSVVDWHVMSLRRQLGHAAGVPRIQTVRGVGYVLTIEGADEASRLEPAANERETSRTA